MESKKIKKNKVWHVLHTKFLTLWDSYLSAHCIRTCNPIYLVFFQVLGVHLYPHALWCPPLVLFTTPDLFSPFFFLLFSGELSGRLSWAQQLFINLKAATNIWPMDRFSQYDRDSLKVYLHKLLHFLFKHRESFSITCTSCSHLS